MTERIRHEFRHGLELHDAALRDFLYAQSYEDVHKLEVVMYAGREGDHPYDVHRTLLEETHTVTCGVIRDKSPLARYLEAGLSIATKAIVDLDAPFPPRPRAPLSEENVSLAEAEQARRLFHDRLAITRATGMALKQSGDPAVVRAAVSALEELATVEKQAVEAYRVAFRRPSDERMLRHAWAEAGAEGPAPGFEPAKWDPWVELVISESRLSERTLSAGMTFLRHAVRYARVGRFLSAAEMLRCFRWLPRMH